MLTAAEMAETDRLAIAGGIAGIDLMEAAGAAVAAAILRRWQPRPTVVLCGPGNNGGDGFVVARILQEFSWPVQLVRLNAATGSKGDAKLAAARWHGPELPPDPGSIADAGLVVDALFGAGLDRPVEGIAKALIDAISALKRDCVAIDVPSGITGDSGEILGAAAPCALTVTFHRPKPAHCLEPARSLCGAIEIARIGIPESIPNRLNPKTLLNSAGLWADAFPWPRASDHKYSRGHGLVLGGAQMTGAARLAARAARRIGTGLLTIASPPSAVPIYAADLAGAIVRPVAEDRDFEKLAADPRIAAVLVGPGAGVEDATRRRVLAVRAAGKPCVIDADGLSVFGDMPDVLFRRLDATCLLTPHGGEFARLFPDLTGDKVARARAAAARSGAVVLLKGADTVIAAPDGLAILSPFGPPTLATGGSGDVLAGLALGLIAQGMAPLWAAAAACWFQAEAARALGPGLIAEDLPEQMPALLTRLMRLGARA